MGSSACDNIAFFPVPLIMTKLLCFRKCSFLQSCLVHFLNLSLGFVPLTLNLASSTLHFRVSSGFWSCCLSRTQLHPGSRTAAFLQDVLKAADLLPAAFETQTYTASPCGCLLHCGPPPTLHCIYSGFSTRDFFLSDDSGHTKKGLFL